MVEEMKKMNNKGQIAWNKGLTKETDERVKKYGEHDIKRMELNDFQNKLQEDINKKHGI